MWRRAFWGGVSGSWVGNHMYTLIALVVDTKGNVTGLKARNPWGADGPVLVDLVHAALDPRVRERVVLAS